MSYPSHTARYLENEVITRSSEWLVPLMYEHLLKHIRRAIVQIEEGDLGGQAQSLDKATEIVAELLCTLDRQTGGQLADSLASLYAYFTIELLNAGREKGVGSLPQLATLVEELHGAWVQAAEMVAPRNPGRTLSASAA